MILYFDGVQVIRLIINYQLLITNAVDDEMLCSLWERGAPAPRNCIFFYHKEHKEKYRKEHGEFGTGDWRLETRPYIFILCK